VLAGIKQGVSGGVIRGVMAELPAMLRLALPVVAAELGWVAMSLVDTIMVGRVSAVAVGAVSIGGMLFYTVATFTAGLMLGLDTVVSQAYGAGDLRSCHRSLLNALYLYLPLPPLIMLLVWWAGPLLVAFGVDAEVARQANSYLRAVAWGSMPLLLYFAFRRYLQAMNLVKPVMFALISANAVHLLANWIFIYGNWGAPALGATGAGWATCFSRVYMAACLVVYTVWHERRNRTGWHDISLRPDWARMQGLLRLGLPAGFQISLEVGVFAAATALIGRLAPVTLAAHQIALNCATVTYMVPLAIGSAAAVRVGQAIGRRNPEGARFAGWTAILLGALFMAVMGALFLLIPRVILRGFTANERVIDAGVALLFVAAVFQLFDGVQTVSTGALRGLGDTHTPMLCNLAGYWVIGLPIGYWLCFEKGLGAQGLWIGLCFALILIAGTLLTVWAKKSARQ
jgi:MATE family multidrug resistance protein